MGIDLLFRISAIGMIVAVLTQVLSKAGRDDQAMLTALAGLVIVLTMVVQQISSLFSDLKSIFGL